MAQISTEQAVEQLHQMFGDYEKASLAAALEVRKSQSAVGHIRVIRSEAYFTSRCEVFKVHFSR